METATTLSSKLPHDEVASPAELIHGTGEMADRTRAFDWASTPLGAISTWPDELLATVNMLLCSQSPMFLWWGNDLIQFYNDAYRPSFGLDKHPSALGQRGKECWPEVWDIVGPQIEGVMQSGQSTWNEDRLLKIYRDGELVDMYWTYGYSPVYTRAGEICGTITVCSETTGRVLTEQKLRASEERFQLALGASNTIGTWDWDVPRDCFRADRNLATLYGVDPERAAAGVRLSEFRGRVHPDDQQAVSAAVASALKFGSGEYASEYRLVQPDGSLRWVSAQGKCTFAEDGSPLRFPGVTVDITASRQTAEDLRSSEARLRLAQAAGKIASWEWDLGSGQVLWNEGGSLLIYGRPASEVEYIEQAFVCVQEEDRASVSESMKPALAGTGEYRSEFRSLWPDGSVHWIQAAGTPVLNAAGETVRIVGVNIDVTEKKLADEALIRNEKLAAVGRLASSIAHEINNPLESVMNLLYLARTTDSTIEVRQYLNNADAELRRVSAITNQTLRFHKQASNAVLTMCEELISSVLSIYQSRILNASIVVEKRNSALQGVLCFDGEIRQVLSNLIGNAIDAMQTRGGRLLLRSREGTDWKTGRRGLILTVADTGSGISRATQLRVREAFFTTKGLNGTGLGLWISQEIIDRHAGKLSLRSRQQAGHSGTVFTMFLPFDAVVR